MKKLLTELLVSFYCITGDKLMKPDIGMTLARLRNADFDRPLRTFLSGLVTNVFDFEYCLVPSGFANGRLAMTVM